MPHRLHQLQPGFTRDLIGSGNAGSGASVHCSPDGLLLGNPGVKVVGFGHDGFHFTVKFVYAIIVSTMMCMSANKFPPPVVVAAKLQGCTNLKLRQLTRRITQHYDAELGQAGLKTTQYSLLSHVLKLGPIRPGDLAQAMKMEASTLTRNLKPLLAAGWVQLGEGVDGRSRLITITEAGREKRQAAQRHWKMAQTRLNCLLGMPRMLALHALIDESLLLLVNSTTGETNE